MRPSQEDLLEARASIYTPPADIDTSTMNTKEKLDLIPSNIITSKDKSFMRNYNLRHNFHFGDCEEQKDPGTIRVWLQNPNGINISKGMDEYKAHLQMMKELQVDIWAAPEHNIDWTIHNNEKLRAVTANALGPCKVVGTSSDEPSVYSYKPGGAMLVAHGNIIGRILKSGEDPSGMGRWCYICFSRYGERKWWVISGYRVSQDTTTGLNTAYNQQERILRKRGEKQPNPKKQWDKDMLSFLQTIDADDQVLLLVDANAGLEDIKFGAFVSRSKLCDIIGGKHGVDSPPTYIGGSKTIDYALGSDESIEAVHKCGLIPFHKHKYTDHRAGFIDFSTKVLFKGIPPKLYDRPTRQFTTKYIAKRNKFLTQATANIKDQQIQQRLQEVEDNYDITDQDETYSKLEKIHQDFHEALLAAAENIPPTPTAWWTVELHQAHQLVTYWAAAISFARNTMVGDEILSYLETQMSEVDIYQGDRNRSMHAQLQLASKRRREARRDSFNKRQKELEKRILEFCDDEDEEKKEEKKQKILKSIKLAEARKRMYSLFRRYLKPKNQSTLGHVDVPDYKTMRILFLACLKQWTNSPQQTQWLAPWITLWTVPFSNIATFLNKSMPHRRVVEKEELNEKLFDFHVEHFQQAQGSPFTISPLSNYFGEFLNTATSDEFLNGDTTILDHPDLDDKTKDVLREIQPKATDPPEIKDTMTAAQVKSGFKIWTETTSTSPLGNHLSLYKAWLCKKRPEDSLSDIQFCTIMAGFFNLAAKLGRPMTRWRTVHNIYLQKDPGVFRIHRMRMIHIIDAELNLFRRELVTRRLMTNAEAHEYLTDTQYGGRKGRSAIDIPFLRALMYDTFHLTRANVAITDCDAKACYDRIVAIVTALAEIKAGLPKNIAMILIKALKQMQYHMMTAYGASEKTNSHSAENPLHGIGQGPTDAPTGNTFNSDITAKCYERKVDGCMLRDPIEELIALIKLLTFVDDSNLTHGGQTFDISPTELMRRIDQEINTWDGYLQVIGQLLEILKSSYSMLVWDFEADGKPRILEEDELPRNTVTLERQGITVNLKRNAASDAPRMLGVHKALTLSEEKETSVLEAKTARYRKAVIACPCQKHEVWISYRTIYIPSVSFSFPAVTMTEKVGDDLHSKLLPALLPRLGYHHGFPRAVIFAPESFYGAGLYHLKALQFAQQVEHLIAHIRANTTVGLAAKIMIRWGQHCSGVGQPILETHRKLPQLEGQLINNLRHGLQKIDGKLILIQPWIRKIQRRYDAHLMDVLQQSEQLNDEEIWRVNRCRYVMQIEHISDMVTSDGTHIHPEFLTTTEPLQHRQQDLLWPQQRSPDQRTWKYWVKILRQVLCSEGNKLKRPLGDWLNNYKPWNVYYDDKVDALFSRQGTRWAVHPVQYRTRRFLEVQTRGSPCGAPLHLKRLSPVTDLIPVKDQPVSRCTVPTQVKLAHKRKIAMTFVEYLSHLPQWEKVLLRNIEELSQCNLNLKTHLQLATELWLVSDGGVDDGLGYFGWAIATDCHVLWQGWGHSQGHPNLIESLRAEGSGMLGLLRFILRYCEFYGVSLRPDTSTHFCDNKVQVGRMNQLYDEYEISPTQWLNADRDIHAQIEQTLEALGLRIPAQHVKGHQDEGKENHKLSWQAKLNILCDKLATKAKLELHGEAIKSRFHLLPAAKIHLVIRGLGIPKSIRSAIIQAWASGQLQKHMHTKYGWTKSTFEDVEWSPGGSVIRASTYYRKRFIIRYTHSRLPVHGEPFTEVPDDTCPYCHASETTDHFLTCSHNPEQWSELVTLLQTKWASLDVDPILRILMTMALLREDMYHTMNTHPDIEWSRYRTLIHNQSKIGWRQIQLGRFSKEWDKQQRIYTKWKHNKTEDKTWLRRTISHIWFFAQHRWHARCEMKHGNVDTYSATKLELQHRIENLYSHKQDLLAQDRKIYNTPVETWKDKSVTAMRQWLKIAQPYITYCLKMAKRQIHHHAADIRQFLDDPPATKIKQPNKRKCTRRRKRRSQATKLLLDRDIREFIPTFQDKPLVHKSVTKNKYNAEPKRTSASSITAYYKYQDRPPDDKSSLYQRRLTDFYILKR